MEYFINKKKSTREDHLPLFYLLNRTGRAWPGLMKAAICRNAGSEMSKCLKGRSQKDPMGSSPLLGHRLVAVTVTLESCRHHCFKDDEGEDPPWPWPWLWRPPPRSSPWLATIWLLQGSTTRSPPSKGNGHLKKTGKSIRLSVCV